MGLIFALAGNQNCGKTTLFNALTGSNQHVGNFPGVTVEKKEGNVINHKEISVVDLPGIYSLSPYTAEEVVTRDFLLDERPDGIINIVDATNLERNLYLSLQLLELRLPTVIALNMMDEVRANGYFIDIEGLKRSLGVEVVPVSASKGEGVGELVAAAERCAKKRIMPQKLDFCSGAVHRAIHGVTHLISDHAEQKNVPARYAATKLVEGDEPMLKRLEICERDAHIVEEIVAEMEEETGTDREAALADMRYEYIDGVCRENVKKGTRSREQQRSVKIDEVLTHKVWALPIFFGIMLFIFWITFGPVGGTLSDLFAQGIDAVTALADNLLTRLEVAPMLRSLIIDGVFSGVGSVLSFLPTIIVLFFCLSILEDSGYMARVAFVMDKLLRKIGLSGRSFVPMLIGFGCSVPAIMATRTLPSERDRRMTILLVPFMSCSAKLPIYALFTDTFFERGKALIMISLYILGIVVGIIYGLIFKNSVFKSKPVPFVMELPAYRFPSAKNVFLTIKQRARDFVVKAFTVIFVATIVIWFLQSFDFRFNMVEDASESMLAALGGLIAPVFKPLGFGDWRASTALITGLTAKEAVKSTFAVLMRSSGVPLAAALRQIFTPVSAFSFLVFTLLYMPCVAAMSAVKRELGSGWGAALAMLSQTSLAWIVSFVVYNIGVLIV